MAGESRFELEGLRIHGSGLSDSSNLWLEILHLPYLGGVVGTAGSEVLDIGREENTSDVVFVGLEMGDWD
jgi:hypothetical protein